MKAIKYTGRIIRLIIVLLAIGLLVNLLVPARSWNVVLETLSEMDVTSQDLDASSEQENGLEESLLEKFRPLIEESNTTNDKVRTYAAPTPSLVVKAEHSQQVLRKACVSPKSCVDIVELNW